MLLSSYSNSLFEAGCDEAGRGCLVGPVFAAAVILPLGFYHPQLNDSKKLTAAKREELRLIIESHAIAWSVAQVDENEIDKINILNASIKAMHLALQKLTQQPDFILVDGNRFKAFKQVPHQCIVKGDATYASIAAASVLAKTHRDAFVLQLHEQYPEYGWAQNKGYGTESHIKAMGQFGLTPYHRKSFVVKKQLKLLL
jgi:ribonuclease HII